jgi:peroxiredoxin
MGKDNAHDTPPNTKAVIDLTKKSELLNKDHLAVCRQSTDSTEQQQMFAEKSEP